MAISTLRYVKIDNIGGGGEIPIQSGNSDDNRRAAMSTQSTQRCTKCRTLRELSDYQVSKTGISGKCMPCISAEKVAAEAKHKADLAAKLVTLQSFDDFLRELESAKDQENGNQIIKFKRETRVASKQPSSSTLAPSSAHGSDGSSSEQDMEHWELRAHADNIAKRIWDTTGYRWTYHRQKARKGMKKEFKAWLFEYNCAQLGARQRKRPVADESRRRPRKSLDVFQCNGWMSIKMEEVQNVLTATIQFRHELNHVPYSTTSVPDDIVQYIHEDDTRTMDHVWEEVLRRYPKPPFARRSVLHEWLFRHSRLKPNAESQIFDGAPNPEPTSCTPTSPAPSPS